MGSAPESLFPSRSSLTNPFEGAAEGRGSCSSSPSSFNPPALRPFPTHGTTTGPGWRLLSGGRALRSRGRAQGNRGKGPEQPAPVRASPPPAATWPPPASWAGTSARSRYRGLLPPLLGQKSLRYSCAEVWELAKTYPGYPGWRSSVFQGVAPQAESQLSRTGSEPFLS